MSRSMSRSCTLLQNTSDSHTEASQQVWYQRPPMCWIILKFVVVPPVRGSGRQHQIAYLPFTEHIGNMTMDGLHIRGALHT